MNRSFCLALLFLFTQLAHARQLPPDVLDRIQTAMSALEMLSGNWEGTGSMMTGPGTSHEATVHEFGGFKLDGTIFQIEGIGRAKESVDGEYPIVHNAFGVISYDLASGKYSMRAYRMGGQYVDADVEVNGNVLRWGFEDPRAGIISYEITVVPQKTWTELGKISRDGGENWIPFFEMSLSYVGENMD